MNTHFIQRTLALAVLCIAPFVMRAQQSTAYVCPPCHNSCDHLEFTKPGACPTCGMGLIPKNTKLITETFSFVFDSVVYSAEVSKPKEGKPTAAIVIVPGHGQTDFVEGSQYYQLRQLFSESGLITLVWDKKGCNKSGGSYEHNQSLRSSAQETLTAISEFRRRYGPELPVGLWGISRAGWICPLVINEDPSIAFWISVSGTDQFDTFRYMLEKNFQFAGRTWQETEILMAQWDHYLHFVRHGGESYAELVKATEKLFNDPFLQSLGQKRITEAEYAEAPAYYQNSHHQFDEQTGVMIMVPDFEKRLRSIQCPVLAIFGDRDSQVDWQSTTNLYQKTIGENSKNLQIMTFIDCNHNMQKCKTGAFNEDLSAFGWQSCDGYELSMKHWLIEKGFAR